MRKLVLILGALFSVIFLFSCDRASTPQNVIKVRDLKIKLSEYFTISPYFDLEIPAEIEFPDKTKSDGKAYVYCMNKTYRISCYSSNCRSYQLKDGTTITDGKFDMNSIWYEYCKSAATNRK